MAAAKGGHKKLIKVLLTDRSFADQACYDGITALMWASANGHTAMVHELLMLGANINAQTHESPISQKARHKAGNTSLMLAARYGHETTTRELVRDADLDLKDADGTTALMYATRNGNVGVTEVLVHAGADVNAARESGFTALMFAAKNGHKQTLNVLLRGEQAIEVRPPQ